MSLRAVETALAADFRRYHVRAQIQRLVCGSFGAFALQLLSAGPHGGVTGWSVRAVVAAAVGAVWVTARSQWPSLPWRLVEDRIRRTCETESTPTQNR